MQWCTEMCWMSDRNDRNEKIDSNDSIDSIGLNDSNHYWWPRQPLS